MNINQFIQNEFKRRNITCNCGSPSSHAPDCSLLLEEDNIKPLWEDMLKEDKTLSVKEYNNKYPIYELKKKKI